MNEPIHEHLKNEKQARMLRESVGSFVEFIEHRSGKMILNRIPPKVARRLAEYVDQFKELIK